MSLLADGFMRRALVEAVLVGALCGVVGVHVVLRRLPFLTLALGHATLPGVALAALLGLPLIAGAGLAGLAVVAAISLLGARERVEGTSAIGVVLAGAFALGVLLASAQPGGSRALAGYLVGSILTVRAADLALTAVAGAAVLLALLALHKELVLGAFDREGMAAQGYPVGLVDFLLLALVEVTVVVAVPAVGTVLTAALITAPAAAARLWCERLGPTMLLAAALGAASGVLGLAASAAWEVAAGGAIVLAAAALFGASLLLAPAGGLARRWWARPPAVPGGDGRVPVRTSPR